MCPGINELLLMGFSDNTEEAVVSNHSPRRQELYSHLSSDTDVLGSLGLADISYSYFSQLMAGSGTRINQVCLHSKNSHTGGPSLKHRSNPFFSFRFLMAYALLWEIVFTVNCNQISS